MLLRQPELKDMKHFRLSHNTWKIYIFSAFSVFFVFFFLPSKNMVYNFEKVLSKEITRTLLTSSH